MSRAHHTRGLTLIELVVALGIFALVAIMGLQSLTVSLSLRDRLGAQANATDQLGQGTALLRNDLASALPMVFFAPGNTAPASAIWPIRGGRGFSLSVGGQPGIPLASGHVDAVEKQRVDWRYHPQDERLTRQAWPTLYPVRASQQGPEMQVLDGVTALSMRSYWSGQGWVPGLRSGVPVDPSQQAAGDDDRAGGVAPEVYSGTLPRAVEITLETRDFGQIVLLEYFQ
ncbi:MAG: type II secretion system protein GspJ [Roseovarius sp.]